MQRAAWSRSSFSGSGVTNSCQFLMRSSTGSVVAVVALELEKPGNLTHVAPVELYSAASTTRAFAMSASARRYSTGITLRNFGRYSSQCSRICAARREPAKRAWREISRCSRAAS